MKALIALLLLSIAALSFTILALLANVGLADRDNLLGFFTLVLLSISGLLSAATVIGILVFRKVRKDEKIPRLYFAVLISVALNLVLGTGIAIWVF